MILYYKKGDIMKAFKNTDKLLLILTIFMFLFGALMILSASNMESFVRYEVSPYHFFFRQLMFLGVGGFLFYVIIRFPTKNYKKISKISFYALLGILLLMLMTGDFVNGSKSWFKILGFTIQPSEFIKVMYIMFVGVYYNINREKIRNSNVTLAMPLILGLTAIALIFMQPDVGTGFILFVILTATFFALSINKKTKRYLLIVFIVAAILGFVIIKSNYVSEEMKSRFDFFDPCSDYQGDGYHVCNSYIAINNGGLLGVGFGNSTQKYLYLPEAHTDFIFPIIMEETGLLFAFVLLGIYVYILYRIYRISKRSYNTRNSLIAYLIGIYIFIHIFINLLGVFGRIPLTGIPLPFLSYGGSYTISLIIALGIVQRIEIENKIHEKRIQQSR